MSYTIDGVSVLTIAIAVWFMGTAITRYIPILSRYNIPVSVTGGLLCSLATAVLYYQADIAIEFNLEMRDLLLLVFFSAVGLSAKIRTLLSGGRILLMLVIAAVCLLILQNSTGVLLAYIFDAPLIYGLFGGSISLAGGYGTVIAWSQTGLTDGFEGAQEVGIAFATFGLIAGGLIGGPIAEWLIRRHRLESERPPVPSLATILVESDQPQQLKTPSVTEKDGSSAVSTTLGMLMALLVCVQAGDLVNKFLSNRGFDLPGFLTAMIVGIMITNTAEFFKVRLDPRAREHAQEISLQLFLSMSLMSMQLWILTDALNKIVFVIFIQTLVIALFTVFIVFRLGGRDYDASVMAAGFAGLGMGATPVGIANMNAVTSKYGPSPKAFLIIPLVGAFFLDIANAIVIKTFLGFSFMQ
jgi:glutamate:Na+ symporter, ESS family